MKTCAKIKPDLIMASISSTGQTGPLRDCGHMPLYRRSGRLDSTLGYEEGRPLA